MLWYRRYYVELAVCKEEELTFLCASGKKATSEEGDRSSSAILETMMFIFAVDRDLSLLTLSLVLDPVIDGLTRGGSVWSLSPESAFATTIEKDEAEDEADHNSEHDRDDDHERQKLLLFHGVFQGWKVKKKVN